MTVADTGVLLAIVDDAHPRHDDALRLLAVGPISVTPPTLVETTLVVRRHARSRGLDGNAIARQALRLLRALPGYRLAPAPPEETVAAPYDHKPELSYADAWNLATSLSQEETLATFDAKLARVAARGREP